MGQKEAFLEHFAELEYIQENEEQTGSSTIQIREFIWSRTKQWDDELNKAYQVIMDYHPDANAIKDEQRKWLEEVENESSKIYQMDATMGTMMHIESDTYTFEETKKRAYELVNNYMD